MTGRVVLGLIIAALVLAAVVATAGQHTSFAAGGSKLFVESADFIFEQAFVFNGS